MKYYTILAKKNTGSRLKSIARKAAKEGFIF